jgi:4-hydroxy-2-oxoheptanedioate aldolase
MSGRAPLPRRLAEAPALLATFSVIAAPEIVELIAIAGFDAVILDTEHGPYGIADLSRLIVAARAAGLYSIARVRSNDAALIGGALDAGADGVLVPQIASAEAARAAVAAAKFAPDGIRGANPFVRAADYGARPSWFAIANPETAVLLMIEGPGGIAALPEILDIPALTGIFLGPVDLSHALGVPGETGHPAVVSKMAEAIAAAAAKGKASAVFAAAPDFAATWREAGVSLIGYGVDTAHALAGLRAAAEAARS